MLKNQTAVLLFSRTAATEARAKRLAAGKRASELAAAFLINHARTLAAQSGLPVFFISEKQQRGSTFGERLANAFEDIFQKGFTSVIAIGNDCLTLTARDIFTAANALQTTPSVLGGSEDGGAYLIGFQRIAFQKQGFQHICWQSKDTFSGLVAFFNNQHCTTYFLPPKSDIDAVSDWHKTLQKVSWQIRKQLIALLDVGYTLPRGQFTAPVNLFFLRTAHLLRAPPA
jgi:uncharacterized protein